MSSTEAITDGPDLDDTKRFMPLSAAKAMRKGYEDHYPKSIKRDHKQAVPGPIYC